jgi:sodium/hydrogen antiporter
MTFFGIRGIGTPYYVQYAFNRVGFAERDLMWAVATFAVLVSILLHGATSVP